MKKATKFRCLECNSFKTGKIARYLHHVNRHSETSPKNNQNTSGLNFEMEERKVISIQQRLF